MTRADEFPRHQLQFVRCFWSAVFSLSATAAA